MLSYTAKSLRSFIGAKDFNESRRFYIELGFKEDHISKDMVRIQINESLSFYLQDYYVKDWNNNSMLFLEVDDVETCYRAIHGKGLQDKYRYVRITDIKMYDWGREFFMHDPSGVLWHFGEFNMD